MGYGCQMGYGCGQGCQGNYQGCNQWQMQQMQQGWQGQAGPFWS